MRHAATPLLHESVAPDFTCDVASLGPPAEADPQAAYRDLHEASQDVTVSSRHGDIPKSAGSQGVQQQLKPYAAKVLMKVLYAARYARPDLLRAVCWLAQYINKMG